MASDIFLKVDTLRQGVIKGESQDSSHKDEIDVDGWSWGMESKAGMAAGGASGKASIHELNVSKRIDSASTALMSAMRNNETIKKAVLTARKSGGKPYDYLKITLENGRITKLDVSATNTGEVLEQLSFSFQKISVEYTPQGEDGGLRGAMMFSTETANRA